MNTATPETALYDRIGGEKAIAAMVDRFYDRLQDQPELVPYFKGVAMDKLRRMQVEFFSAALGGPVQYSGRPVYHAHQGLRITRAEFQLFVEQLFVVMQDYPLDDGERYAIITRINTYADDVVSSGTGP